MSKPAYPKAGFFDGVSSEDSNEGMTLLEYYAGQALTGIFANQEFFISALQTARERNIKHAEWISTACFEFADAMIKEAEKRTGNPVNNKAIHKK